MSAFTLTEVNEQLTLWKDALKKVAKGQTLSMNGRSITMADLAEIKNTIAEFERRKEALTNNLKGHNIKLASFNS